MKKAYIVMTVINGYKNALDECFTDKDEAARYGAEIVASGKYDGVYLMTLNLHEERRAAEASEVKYNEAVQSIAFDRYYNAPSQSDSDEAKHSHRQKLASKYRAVAELFNRKVFDVWRDVVGFAHSQGF